ncbi:MAG TPA: helix-turn-helix domain-containing protein [Herbaspirillum sp.]|jgi:DNA-binding HxlR family transcriptional regulator
METAKASVHERVNAYDTQCPVARALDSVGQWWNILILREAMYGLTRFDEFEKSLQIAPTMLTRRLKSLVEVGVLERRLYSERPARYEYVLTDAGRDFRSVIVTLYAWGNRHLAPEGAAVVLVNAKSGALADPMLVDRNSGAPINAADFVFAAGPAANERIVKRLAASRELHGMNGADGISGDIPVIAPMPPAPAKAARTAKDKPAMRKAPAGDATPKPKPLRKTVAAPTPAKSKPGLAAPASPAPGSPRKRK